MKKNKKTQKKQKKKTKKSKRKVSKNMTFGQLLDKHPKAAKVLLESGMHCVGCPMSMSETIEEGAVAHGINPEEMINQINKELKKGKK